LGLVAQKCLLFCKKVAPTSSLTSFFLPCLICERPWEQDVLFEKFRKQADMMLQHLDDAAKRRILAPEGGMGRTPLHGVRSSKVAKYLIYAGARDPKTGMTPVLDVVCRRGIDNMNQATVIKIFDVLAAGGGHVAARAKCKHVLDYAKRRPALHQHLTLLMQQEKKPNHPFPFKRQGFPQKRNPGVQQLAGLA
jgi:hypothetical protein